MNSLIAIHRYRDQKHRHNRLRIQRDGQTNHAHASGNMSRREIDDFPSRLLEIHEGRNQTKWIPGGAIRGKQIVFALRKVKFNHYEENIIASGKLLLQGPARPLAVMAEKPPKTSHGEEDIMRRMDGNTARTQPNTRKTRRLKTNRRASQITRP